MLLEAFQVQSKWPKDIHVLLERGTWHYREVDGTLAAVGVGVAIVEPDVALCVSPAIVVFVTVVGLKGVQSTLTLSVIQVQARKDINSPRSIFYGELKRDDKFSSSMRVGITDLAWTNDDLVSEFVIPCDFTFNVYFRQRIT